MTQQNNEAFENWYINENGYKKSELELNERGEYKLLEARLDNKVWQAATQHSEREIAELKAHINVLREALVEVVNRTESFGIESIAQKALASTPAQSLVEHDNEVIERCVKVCNESINTWHASRNIRALKGTS